MNTAIVTSMASVAGAILLYLGTRYAARASKEASSHHDEVTAVVGVAQGYGRLNNDMWTFINSLQVRVSNLESTAAENEKKYRAAVSYISVLLRFIQVHVTDETPPAPPPELGL